MRPIYLAPLASHEQIGFPICLVLRPHWPPELVWGFWLTVSAAVLGGIAAVRVGAPLDVNIWRRSRAAFSYSLSVAVSLVAGFAFLGIAGPFIIAGSGVAGAFGLVAPGLFSILIGGFCAGAIVGAVTTSARARTQAPL